MRAEKRERAGGLPRNINGKGEARSERERTEIPLTTVVRGCPSQD